MHGRMGEAASFFTVQEGEADLLFDCARHLDTVREKGYPSLRKNPSKSTF